MFSSNAPCFSSAEAFAVPVVRMSGGSPSGTSAGCCSSSSPPIQLVPTRRIVLSSQWFTMPSSSPTLPISSTSQNAPKSIPTLSQDLGTATLLYNGLFIYNGAGAPSVDKALGTAALLYNELFIYNGVAATMPPARRRPLTLADSNACLYLLKSLNFVYQRVLQRGTTVQEDRIALTFLNRLKLSTQWPGSYLMESTSIRGSYWEIQHRKYPS